MQTSTFKGDVWEQINAELTQIIGEDYGVERLKGKYNRFRQQHCKFSILLARTGVTWDLALNKVNAPEDVWQDMYTVYFIVINV